MQEKINIFDREGRVYQVNAFEVDGLLTSGAYFMENPEMKGIIMPEADTQGMIVVYEIKTGKKYMRRPVDARELVASGAFCFELPRKAPDAVATPPSTPPSNSLGGTYPELSMESNKADIYAALTKFGVQYRQSMDKADLLQLWQDFLDEQNTSG